MNTRYLKLEEKSALLDALYYYKKHLQTQNKENKEANSKTIEVIDKLIYEAY